MNFEWDSDKAKKNLKKHKIAFQEAGTVFGDRLAITFYDPDHSIDEHRLLTFGTTRTGKPVIVSHTEKENSIRIISACIMTAQERKIYEKE